MRDIFLSFLERAAGGEPVDYKKTDIYGDDAYLIRSTKSYPIVFIGANFQNTWKKEIELIKKGKPKSPYKSHIRVILSIPIPFFDTDKKGNLRKHPLEDKITAITRLTVSLIDFDEPDKKYSKDDIIKIALMAVESSKAEFELSKDEKKHYFFGDTFQEAISKKLLEDDKERRDYAKAVEEGLALPI